MSAWEVIARELSLIEGFWAVDKWAQRVLDALKAAGYEVVKVPELDDFEPGPFFDAALTRKTAADLLATVNAAEKRVAQ